MKAKNEIDISNLPNGVMLLTVEDAAKALQMSRDFIYKLIYKGKLRVIKIGRSNRILPVDLENFVKERIY